jgi:outer membrane protein assembly factor BamE
MAHEITNLRELCIYSFKERSIMTILSSTGKKMKIATWCLQGLCILSLTSCATYDFSRRIVQQGNLLTPSTVNRLTLGMSKQDTAILLGTSLLSPTFNNDRWDYAYTRRKGATSNTVRHVSLYFSNDKLIRIEQ